MGIVLDGELLYTIHQPHGEQKPQILRAGEGVFVNTQALHTAKQQVSGSTMYGITFPSDFFDGLPTGILHKKHVLPLTRMPLAGFFLTPGQPESEEILDTLRLFQGLSSSDPAYELLCMEYMCRIWRNLTSAITRMPSFSPLSPNEFSREKRIRIMLSYIHTHYAEPMTIRDIAASASIGKSECFRCFKGIVGKTPLEYLLEYRLSKAIGLLATTDQSVLNISLSCGFNSPSYFGKIFKNSCGMTPNQFRMNRLIPDLHVFQT